MCPRIRIDGSSRCQCEKGYIWDSNTASCKKAAAFFMTRAKTNFNFKRLYSQAVDKSTGLKCDQIIVLNNFYAKKDYPEKLRRIRYFDSENNKQLSFLTNNFTLPTLTITELYRCRWKFEKIPLLQALTQMNYKILHTQNLKQLNLFE